MSRTNHWPKDRAGVARHIHDLVPGQERTAILDWIDSLDASFGFKITEHDGNTYLKALDITVQVDESPAVIELLRLWAKNEVSPVPRNSLISIDPDADQKAIKKIQGLSIRNPPIPMAEWRSEPGRENDTSQLLAVNMPGDPDSQPDPIRSEAASPDLIEPLTDRDREILLYMLENGHTKAKPISKPELAKKLTRGGHKSMTDHLQTEGLTDSKRSVGTWLTAKGRSMAELIKQNEPY